MGYPTLPRKVTLPLRAKPTLSDSFPQPCSQLVLICQARIALARIGTQLRRTRERGVLLVLGATHIDDTICQGVKIDAERRRSNLSPLRTSSTR